MIRKSSKEILAESFREIAESKAIDKITVKDITENCGYSPATFYRQFKDKFDLIAWDYTRELKGILSEMNGSRTEWHNALKRIASYFQERKVYLANLLLHTNGLESFIINMQDVNYQYLKDVVQNACGTDAVDTLTDMYIRLYVLGSSQLTCEWVLGKREGTAEELAMVYEQTLPLPLQRYFTE